MPIKHQDHETHSGMAFAAIYFISIFILMTLGGVLLAIQ